ncbi:hypothetical protein DL771_008162 [Monosporascus sp. 5C6A]|nr:hypothetical protein DL771_008162 [Monosporascus sp. 5C6A]
MEVDSNEHARAPSQPNGVPQLPKVRYIAKCRYRDGPDFEFSQDNEPISLQVSEPTPESDDESVPAVISLVTRIYISDATDAEENEGEQSSKPNHLTGKRVTKIGNSWIVMNSADLCQMIRDVVDYYPSQNLAGDSIIIHEPYGVLAHYMKDLEELLSKLGKEPDTSEEATIRREHLQILVDFFRPYFQRMCIPAEKRLSREAPTVTFKDVWYLLRPGTISYAKWDEEWIGCAVEKVTPEEADDGHIKSWAITVWFVDHMWRSGQAFCAIAELDIDEFDGEKMVNDLPVFPAKYFDMLDGGERKSRFERRGERMRDILWKGNQYMSYDGETMEEVRRKYKGRVIIGPTNDIDAGLPAHNWTFDMHESDRTAFERADSSKVVNPFPRKLDPKKESLVIHIDNALDLEEVDKVPDAIIDPEKLRIIKALSDQQIKKAKPWSPDFIKNKGEGVVVLLHGPPGVGKTYTVETTALRMKRPLISLTIAEIGTKEEKVEAELTKWFALAQRWQAILLIDECDIFLERRVHQDIARNGVVSAFLRKMEYFGGLLFLTTNRVGNIDDAFISRVHAVIGFGKLDVEQRSQIWKSLLEKVARERKGEIRVSNGARKFIDSKEMRDMDWNGREIRNAVQTAIALAEYEARESPDFQEDEEIIVEADQFRAVLEMNKTFRAYLTSIKSEDEAERARMDSWRNDNFKTG